MPFPPALLSHKILGEECPRGLSWADQSHSHWSLELRQKCSAVCALGSRGLAVFGAMCSEAVKTSAEREREIKINLQREKQRGEREKSVLPGFLQVSWLLGLVPQDTGLPPTFGLKFTSLICNKKSPKT